MEISVKTGSATKTSTGAERGIDVTFELTIDGETARGECTLLPHEDGRPGYGAWGDIDHWLDGRTCARVRDLKERTEVLGEILAACDRPARDAAALLVEEHELHASE